MKTDSLFYRLFQELPELIFELAEWPVPTGAVYTLHAEEVKQASFRLDGLLLPAPELPDLPGVFIETQFQLDNNCYSHWFTQIFLFLYRRRWQGPWRAVVIFPSRKMDPQPPVAYQPLLESSWVKRVYLEDLKQRTDLTPGPRLMQLIVAEPDVAMSQAQALLTTRGGPTADPDWSGWLDLIETIVMYKLPQLSCEEIQRMLHLPEVELKQTRFYQDVFAEGRTEGRQQEAAELVLRLLRRRLGAVPAEVESQIRALPVADLETLGEELLDWHTLAELTAWLQRRDSRGSPDEVEHNPRSSRRTLVQSGRSGTGRARRARRWNYLNFGYEFNKASTGSCR